MGEPWVVNKDPLGLQWQECWPNKPLARGGRIYYVGSKRPRKKEAGMQVAQKGCDTLLPPPPSTLQVPDMNVLGNVVRLSRWL
jgi:hypothetical protein